MGDKTAFFRYFFLGVFALLVYQLLRMVSVFLVPLSAGLALVVIFYPLHLRFLRSGRKPASAAVFSTLSVVLLMVLPLAALGLIVAEQSVELYPSLRQWLERALESEQGISSLLPPAALNFWADFSRRLGLEHFELRRYLLEHSKEGGQFLAQWGAVAVKNAASFLMDVLILIFTLFFLFRDGSRVLDWLVHLIPMEENHKKRLSGTVFSTFNAVVRGVFFTAAAQGVLAGIGYVLAGLPFPVIWALATAFLSLLPVGGAAIIWAPASLYLYSEGAAGSAIFLFIWGALAVSLSDNFLKPALIGSRANIPMSLLFLGILGGMKVYGFFGIILGPLLIACLLAAAEIYRQEFTSSHREVH